MAYYRNEVLTDSPYLYLTFENGSLDSNLGSYSGSLSSSAGGYALATGKIGKAPDFTGPATAARIGYTASGGGFSSKFNTNAWTYEMWFKVDAFSSGYMSLFQYNDGSNLIDALFDYSDSKKLKVRHKAQGGTLYTISTTHTQNTSWHHLAITRSGTTLTVYVDGTSVGSTTIAATNPNFSTSQVFYVGAYGSSSGNDNMDGLIDEIALYGTALSSGRVSAHYGADLTGGGYTAQAMTASADMPDHKFTGENRQYLVTADSYALSGAGTNYGASTTLRVGKDFSAQNYTLFVKFADIDALAGSESIGTAKLRLHVDTLSDAGNGYKVYLVTSTWSEAAKPTPTTTLKSTQTAIPSGGWIELDVSSIISDWLSGSTNYGIAVESSTAPTAGWNVFDSRENTDDPQLIVEYIVPTPVNHAADPMTASALMVDPVITVGVSGGYTAQAMTASAAMPDPTIEATDSVSVSGQPLVASAAMPTVSLYVEHGADILAEPMAAAATMPGGGFAIPLNFSASPMTASALVVGATATGEKSAVFAAPVLTASVTWKQPAEVNGNPITLDPNEDPYYKRMKALNPKVWYRFNNTGAGILNVGSTAPGAGADIRGSGVTVGLHAGPEGRHNIHFTGDGSYIEQTEPVDETLFYSKRSFSHPQATLDFGIRTTKKNQFVMASADSVQREDWPETSEGSPVEMWLENGRIKMVAHRDVYGRPTFATSSFTGFQDIADGEWHYISLRLWDDDGLAARTQGGTQQVKEVWIDGKLDVRRYATQGGSLFVGMPDWIGSRLDAVRMGTNRPWWPMPPLPETAYFEGDLSEMSFIGGPMSQHQGQRLYYDFMGIRAIEATPMEAFAFTPAGARGKGNQKRALVLHWYDYDYRQEVAGDLGNAKHLAGVNFDPTIGSRDELYGYKLFHRSVVNSRPGYGYRDPVTDDPQLIDLKTDVDILDYDMIMFRDWPFSGGQIDDINYYYEPHAIEGLVADLRWANSLGLGLLVTHPRMAVDLGIVDRVEEVSSLREFRGHASQGNALGLYDYGSAVKFPWNIQGDSGLEGLTLGSVYNGQPMNTDPAFLRNKAYFYGDTNKNDRFRVRAAIEGLTDLPSYMIQDAIYQSDFSSWGWQMIAYKYLHRMNGLQIGDEYIFHGTDMGYNRDALSADYNPYRYGRHNFTFATPLANVKAGTVVTTFGATLWDGETQKANPYADYATTIVLKRGDELAGTPVGGRIFVNFTEQPSIQPTSVVLQILPENDEDFPHNYNPDTPAQREWEYSDTRKTLSNSQAQSAQQYVNIALPDGSVQSVPATGQPGETLTMTRSSQLFPRTAVTSLQMVTRGIIWLSLDTRPAAGDVNPGAVPMAASAAMPNPTVVAERDVEVMATPFNALAVMPKVAEDETGDAEIHTLPMTAEATFTGYGKTIAVEPMTASATLVDNLGLVNTHSEGITLTLYGVNQEITLYLKEEA